MKKYLGSTKLEVSKANKEIIPDSPSEWTMGYKLKKFSLLNESDCTLIVNGNELFLKANQGFSNEDAAIESVKIKENGINYNWVGTY